MIKEVKNYPFSGIVGQEDMKKALLLNIINPSIGGVLIRGEKGTAKSTAVRAIADLVPSRQEIENCKFFCDPVKEDDWCNECIERFNRGEINVVQGRMRVVNLPISATEDRVVGTLDIENAIKTGEKKFEEGILAQANRNILYVDEVNLLEDHIVDLLLDSAAMGVNIIEREGISYSHPSRFILIGTMNPEEGDLRPQLVDRFGLVVDIVGERDVESRVKVMERRLAFEDNPLDFENRFKDDQRRLSEKIVRAKEILDSVTYDEDIIELIAKISIEIGVDGHRADITLLKTAITNVAYEGRSKVEKEDIIVGTRLALPHRMRRRPFEEESLDFNKIAEIIQEV